MGWGLPAGTVVLSLVLACGDAASVDPGPRPEICNGWADEDRDGRRDCRDPDCEGSPLCIGMREDAALFDAARPDAGVDADSCRVDRYEATPLEAFPIDVVFVIDGSGSMFEEDMLVEEQMNGFARAFETSSIDARIVVIALMDRLTIEPPLATDATRFRFVEQYVDSDSALRVLLEQFDRYSDFLRDDALTHFVVVTDDESALGAVPFRDMMQSILWRPFTFHSIASPPGSTVTEGVGRFRDGCEGPYGTADDNGEVYWELSRRTGGATFSICSPDWSLLFDDLTDAVIFAPLPCVLTLPDPPAGSVINPDRINVVLEGPASREVIGRASGPGACGEAGWYYDDPADPEKIRLCPATCDRVRAGTVLRVVLEVGCRTILI